MEYETLLKEALNELTSLRMINDLLQKDINLHSTLKNTRKTIHNFADSTAVPEINGEWTTITSKNHMSKSRKYTQSIIDTSVQFPRLSNRYLPLTTVSADNVRTIPVNFNRKITAKGSNKVNKGASRPPYITTKTVQKPKMLILGDSHARGCAANLKSSLNENFEVTGTLVPGSRLEHITNLARSDISHMNHNDFVVVWGGTNDISKNESNTGLKHLRKFALRNKHTNIITVAPPHRYDLPDFSCVNHETQVFKRKLRKQLKDMQHTHTVDVNLTRDEFTRHGLHLNYLGKERIAKAIEHSINTSSMTRDSAIGLNWKEAPPRLLSSLLLLKLGWDQQGTRTLKLRWVQQRKMTSMNKEIHRDLHADRRDPLQLETKIFFTV
jgi:lysophospholipase L1-like esterase